MKASVTASIIALSASAFASPLSVPREEPTTVTDDFTVRTNPVQLFTFSITNDVTGQTASTSVGVNSPPVSFKNLFYPWAGNLIREDMLIATSAMNLNPTVMNFKCTIKGWGREMQLDDQTTFTELDNAPGEAKETDVTDFTIECKQ